ncbi:MAG TPA: tyrosine-type recombinase/integrase [Accumulibacter sp.]|nr:tyrosine-type recombinase/integrase [Accumulibacter sp.]
MPKSKRVYPALTRSMLVSEWPANDRRIWLLETDVSRNTFSGGVASTWRPRTAQTVAESYGHALDWLRQRGILVPESCPAERWPLELVKAYAMELCGRVAPATAKGRLVNLQRALVVLAPKAELPDIFSIADRIGKETSHARKRGRLQRPADIVDLGIELMRSAERGERESRIRNAVQFREGLQMALLATCPVRRQNFIDIEIGRHLHRVGNQWWLKWDAEEVKNRTPIECPVAEILVPYLEQYMSVYRPELARGNTRSKRLWLTQFGEPQTAHSFQIRVAVLTKRAFDKPMSPHLFRDSVATSVAIESPEQVRMAATLLGHRSFATTERHYNLATSLSASREINRYIQSIRGAKRRGGHGRMRQKRKQSE